MKRAASIVAVLSAATIAACFSKPSAPHTDDGGINTGDDARRDGGGGVDVPDAPPACGTQDNFDNALIAECEAWGTATKSTMATISRPSGTLDFNFTGSTASASCSTKAPFNITKGTSVHVTDYANATTSFALTIAGQTTTFQANYTGSSYTYNVSCTGQTGTAPSTSTSPPPGWIQMRVLGTNPVRVTVELSTTGDAGTFVMFKDCFYNMTAPTMGDVTLMGSGSGTSDVKFDDFNVKNCPPP